MSTTETPDQVVPAMVDGGTWSASFGLSWTGLMLHDQARSGRIFQPGGGYLRKVAGTMGVAAGRNEIAARFLSDYAAPWLLMVDTDMGFEPDTLDRMVQSASRNNVLVLGALAFAQQARTAPETSLYARRTRIIPTLYRYVEVGDERGFRTIEQYQRDAFQLVDATGAACLLIHRAALNAVGPNPFRTMRIAGGLPGGADREFSEDLSFCARLANARVSIGVDTAIKTSHYKGGIYLDEPTYSAQAALMGANPLGVPPAAAAVPPDALRWTPPLANSGAVRQAG